MPNLRRRLLVKGKEELECLVKHLESSAEKNPRSNNLAVTQILAKNAVRSQFEELKRHVFLEGVESLEQLVHNSVQFVMQSSKVPQIKRLEIGPLYLYPTRSVLLLEDLVEDYIVAENGNIFVIGTLEMESENVDEEKTVEDETEENGQNKEKEGKVGLLNFREKLSLHLRCYGVDGIADPVIIKTDMKFNKTPHDFIQIFACNDFVCVKTLFGIVTIYSTRSRKMITSRYLHPGEQLKKICQDEENCPTLVSWSSKNNWLKFQRVGSNSKTRGSDTSVRRTLLVLDSIAKSWIQLYETPRLVCCHGNSTAVIDNNDDITIFHQMVFDGKSSRLQHGMCHVDQKMEFWGEGRLFLSDFSCRLVTVCAEVISENGRTSFWTVEEVDWIQGYLKASEKNPSFQHPVPQNHSSDYQLEGISNSAICTASNFH